MAAPGQWTRLVRAIERMAHQRLLASFWLVLRGRSHRDRLPASLRAQLARDHDRVTRCLKAHATAVVTRRAASPVGGQDEEHRLQRALDLAIRHALAQRAALMIAKRCAPQLYYEARERAEQSETAMWLRLVDYVNFVMGRDARRVWADVGAMPISAA